MALAGKAEFFAAESLALAIVSELHGIAADLALASRENVFEVTDILSAIDSSLEELQSTVDTYSKQLQEKFY